MTFPPQRHFPAARLRRLRQTSFIRDLVTETQLSSSQLIYPIFITEGTNQKQPIEALPGQFRLSTDHVFSVIEKSLSLGVQNIALFPVINSDKRTDNAEEAHNPDGLIPSTISKIKTRFPKVGLISDIALDPYTSHGQDGLVSRDNPALILNDETLEVLGKQAQCHAQAGADIVAPSDMMDGRIGHIRTKLDDIGKTQTIILAYSAKYASSFYGPFRQAVQSDKMLGNADKKTYQMNIANRDEALHETLLDLQEGADIAMVKPGTLYLDIIQSLKASFKMPVFSYHVSGEYAMLKAASEKGWLNYNDSLLETMMCLKRAGSDAILSYAALDAAALLNKTI